MMALTSVGRRVAAVLLGFAVSGTAVCAQSMTLDQYISACTPADSFEAFSEQFAPYGFTPVTDTPDARLLAVLGDHSLSSANEGTRGALTLESGRLLILSRFERERDNGWFFRRSLFLFNAQSGETINVAYVPQTYTDDRDREVSAGGPSCRWGVEDGGVFENFYSREDAQRLEGGDLTQAVRLRLEETPDRPSARVEIMRIDADAFEAAYGTPPAAETFISTFTTPEQ